MEKFEKAVDLAEHPEKYSQDEIRALLEDDEIREAYNAICDVDSGLNFPRELSSEEIEREWKRFEQSLKTENHREFKWFNYFSRRAAVIGGVVTISLVAMAIGGAILMQHDAPEELLSVELVHPEKEIQMTASIAPDSVVEEKVEEQEIETKVFENETLENILDEMARHYGFKVRILNSNTAGLRLYFRWNPAEELQEVIKQLNNFERINLVLSDDILTVK